MVLGMGGRCTHVDKKLRVLQSSKKETNKEVL